MNISALDLNVLVALEALLEEANVTRAAQRISISQPAMSHALKRLRSLLGDPLLVRVGTHMQRTSRGESLRYPVKDALARVRDLLVSADFDPAQSTRTFRIFVADNASELVLPALLRRLREEAPNVSIRVQPSRGNVLDPFELARSIDVAIACTPHFFKGFYQQRLFTDRDACAVRRGNPVAKKIASAEEFLKARHVAVVGREAGEDPVDTWLREEGLARNVMLTVPHYLQALHVASQSDLIAVIPERLIRAYGGAIDVGVVAVPLEVGTFDEFLLHPAASHHDPGCVWLRGVLGEVAKALGPLDGTAEVRNRRRAKSAFVEQKRRKQGSLKRAALRG
jgi:DNA-binding transcriptional LysR family regulator